LADSGQRSTSRQLQCARPGRGAMATLVVLSRAAPGEVLPALDLLDHRARTVPLARESLVDLPEGDLLVVDGREDLAAARGVCRLARDAGHCLATLLVLTEGGCVVVTAGWGCDDVVL